MIFTYTGKNPAGSRRILTTTKFAIIGEIVQNEVLVDPG